MDHRVYSLAMKINRHGRAKVLTQLEIQLIFSHGLDNDRDGRLTI
jgi:integrase/recombinase XerD